VTSGKQPKSTQRLGKTGTFHVKEAFHGKEFHVKEFHVKEAFRNELFAKR